MVRLAIALILFLSACGDDRRKLVVFMGDSITAYWMLPVSNASNAGVPGDTSDMMAARFQTDVLDQHPTTVVILAGTNDIRHYGYASDQSHIVSMLQAALATGAHVILGTLPPINDWNSQMPVTADQGNALVLQWNESLKTLCLTSCQIADYHSSMILPDGTQNPQLFNTDRLHPNPSGYVVMWSVLSPVCADCIDHSPL